MEVLFDGLDQLQVSLLEVFRNQVPTVGCLRGSEIKKTRLSSKQTERRRYTVRGRSLVDGRGRRFHIAVQGDPSKARRRLGGADTQTGWRWRQRGGWSWS